MYEDVKRTGDIFRSFAILAILVACLGLFALSAFMVEQRSKEMSIRKVLGASMGHILGLLSFNFIKLVLLSFTIAVPIALYLMEKWLEDFVYRIPVSGDIFLIAGLLAIGIAAFAISYQSIKAALIDPVKSLRSE
jgi:putative ABC transport system permease protein